MKIRTSIAALAIALCAHTHAADWDATRRGPAQIEVINMKPKPLVAGKDKKGWAKVPEQLSKNGAVVYMPAGNTNGVADIKVTQDGYLILACNYDYQGNDEGKWDEEIWNEHKFKSKGWDLIGKDEAGSGLVKGDNRQQVLFGKQVRKGEALRLRCNKYDPPFPILVGRR